MHPYRRAELSFALWEAVSEVMPYLVVAAFFGTLLLNWLEWRPFCAVTVLWALSAGLREYSGQLWSRTPYYHKGKAPWEWDE